MKLTHIGISNFRSIGEEFVTIDLTKKINVLVGANNCGKSSVLLGLLHLKGEERQHDYSPSDYHKLNRQREPVFRAVGEIKFQSGAPFPVHFDFNVLPSTTRMVATSWDSFDQGNFQNLWHNISGRGIGHLSPADLKDYMRARGAEFVQPAVQDLQPTVLVPQFREIGSGAKYELRGTGIVAQLAAWDRPDFGKRGDRKKIEQVRNLMRELIQRDDAEIEVSRENSQILVTIGDLQLPLSSYGTGIHEIIILAIAVLSHENTRICIEEPEIHLHPLLQRRFLEFLRKETTNRYVITTHSPALIAPNDDTAVTHLWLENGVTKSRLIETTEHSLGALRDLGAKASDILQANSVIWVEGPSDRIYLNHWLELLYPGQFREGIDYSIMFYGGRLLSHVSLGRENTEDADDLVQLLRINQHSAIVIDSDRRKSADPLNGTKLRVQKQCAESAIPCWITDGREIENYLPLSVLNATYGELSGLKIEIKLRPFGSIEEAIKKALKKDWSRANYYDQAKPKMARLISAKTAKSDLTPKVIAWMEKLVRVIRHDTP